MRSIDKIKIEKGVKLKHCSMCKEFLSLDQFTTSKTGILGLRSECKLCFNERNYRKKEKEEIVISFDDMKPVGTIEKFL